MSVWINEAPELKPGDILYSRLTRDVLIAPDTRLSAWGRVLVPASVSHRITIAQAEQLARQANIGVHLVLGKSHPQVATLFSGPLTSPWRYVVLEFAYGETDVFIHLTEAYSLWYERRADSLGPRPALDPGKVSKMYADAMRPAASIRLPRVPRAELRRALRAVAPEWDIWYNPFYPDSQLIGGPLRQRRAVAAMLRQRFSLTANQLVLSRPDHVFTADGQKLACNAMHRWPYASWTILALMLVVDLPPYVVLEIVDWLPEIEHHRHIRKIRYIEQIQASIRRVKNDQV